MFTSIRRSSKKRRDILKLLPVSVAGKAGLQKAARCVKKDSRPLSLRYLDTTKQTLEKIRSTELDNLLEASYHIARTYKNGGTCYST